VIQAAVNWNADVDAEVVNLIVVCVEVFWNVALNMNIAGVSSVNTSAVGTTDYCDGGGCPMGL
jgi:hypothetical protein